MRGQKQTAIRESDVFDILSATWILACNDENPIITYEGVKYRLGLPDDLNDIKELIQSRGELFRRGVPCYRLDQWKEEMRAGKHLPSWIRDIEDKELRKKTIDALTTDDIFRSQFRAGKDEPRSPVEFIDWGLQHIDRLRKASIDAREESAKSWQMWLVFVVGIINIAVTIVLAILKNSQILK